MHSYCTIKNQREPVLFKDRGSKFYGMCYYMEHASALEGILYKVAKIYPKAGHHCYAYRLLDKNAYRSNDDGEPTNSAGPPILARLDGSNLINTLIVVSRIYGGTNLGVGGLIKAYGNCAQMSIEAATLHRATVYKNYIVSTSYTSISHVMRAMDQFLMKMERQIMKESCIFYIKVPAAFADEAVIFLKQDYKVKVEQIISFNL